MQGRSVIVFSGFNQRAVIAFLRTMDSKRIPYGIIARSMDDSILQTTYKSRVSAVRESIPLNLKDILKCIGALRKETASRDHVIAPSTEALNRFILKHRVELGRVGCMVPLVEEKTYEMISDKYSFGRLCSLNNIPVPAEYRPEDPLRYPFVAKPRKYRPSSDGTQLTPIIITNKIEHNEFKKGYNPLDFYLQEFIEGKSLYLLYYFHRNGRVFKFSQRNVAQQPEGKSIVAAVPDGLHLSRESCRYERLFKNCKFYGLVMVEVRQKGRKYYMIEANPRFWGPSQLFVDAGHNFFEVFLHDFGLCTILPKFHITRKVKYFWRGGIAETFRQKKDLTYYQGNRERLMDDLSVWLKWDVYKREDTMNIFVNELS